MKGVQSTRHMATRSLLDNLPTNQLVVSQVAHWSTRGL